MMFCAGPGSAKQFHARYDFEQRSAVFSKRGDGNPKRWAILPSWPRLCGYVGNFQFSCVTRTVRRLSRLVLSLAMKEFNDGQSPDL